MVLRFAGVGLVPASNSAGSHLMDGGGYASMRIGAPLQQLARNVVHYGAHFSCAFMALNLFSGTGGSRF